jgi:hypothetical protein
LVLGFGVMLTGTLARFCPTITLIAVSLAASTAQAQTAARDPVTAEALFLEGKRLMQGRDYAAACPKLAESQRLDPSGGTIFALGLCYEGAGKTATAWSAFNDALSEARQNRRADREAAASEHIRSLEQRLTRLRIDVPHPVAGLEVLRNGIAVGSVLWATAIPVDPGEYTFEAHAPGKLPWKWATHVDRPGEIVPVSVPDLANAPVAAPPPPVVVEVKPAAVVVPPPPPPKKSYLGAEIGLGVAVAGAIVGTGLGLAASSEWSSAKKATGQDRPNMASTAGTEADVATGAFVVCGAAAVTAGVLFTLVLTSDLDTPRDADRPHARLRIVPMIGPGTYGLSFGGSL